MSYPPMYVPPVPRWTRPGHDLPADASLADARDWLTDRLYEGGSCPCCGQRAQLYRRRITRTSAQSLVTMYRTADQEYQHLPTTLGRGTADEAKMAYWGLIAELTEGAEVSRRPDGGRAGWWRVTDHGVKFLAGEITVPKYALVYDGRLWKFDTSESVTISDALGAPFDLTELMEAGR